MCVPLTDLIHVEERIVKSAIEMGCLTGSGRKTRGVGV